MDFENYEEGQSMQRPPPFESNGFIYWKNHFETYVKSMDIDLSYIMCDVDYVLFVRNVTTGRDEVIPRNRNFIHALHPKWRAKVTAIEESKDLSKSLDELMVTSKYTKWSWKRTPKLSKAKKDKYTSIALKAKTELSGEDTSTSGSEDEEYAMAVRDFKKFFRRRGKFIRQPRDEKKSAQNSQDDKKAKSQRKCFECGDPNHFIGECPKPPWKGQKAFVGRSWSDSGEDDEEINKAEVFLMAQESNESAVSKSTDHFPRDPASTAKGSVGPLDRTTHNVRNTSRAKFVVVSRKSKPSIDHIKLKPSLRQGVGLTKNEFRPKKP
ncbi:zf-CCHC domain-containing protein [Tanacetum coccineum]